MAKNDPTVTEVTKTTPPTEVTKAAAQQSAPAQVPFPIDPKKATGSHAETIRIWARQSKQGLITLCNHTGPNGERCYYPATHVRDGSNELVVGKDSESAFVMGVCSYAGEMHPPIKIRPAKKEDDI